MIEVEKKFIITDSAIHNLHSSGAKLIKTKTFTDLYFDTEDHCLTSKNYWLRLRNDKWQLKSPANENISSSDELLLNSTYLETEIEDAIFELIKPILKDLLGRNNQQDSILSTKIISDEEFTNSVKQKNFHDLDNSTISDATKHLPLESLINLPLEPSRDSPNSSKLVRFLLDCSCKCFCKISTTRQNYDMNGFIIDLDTMDTGYTVGEIELIVENKESIAFATERINQLAIELGIPIDVPVPGKISNYLKKNNIDHYNKLQALKIFV